VCQCARLVQAVLLLKGQREQVADWELCGQCGRRYWVGDSYRPVPPPPRLPYESLIRYLLRASFTSIRRASSWHLWNRGFFAVCEECSAKNDEGWKAHERLMKQKARLESVEKMLAGLRQPPPAEEQLEQDWDARRAGLIRGLEAQRAEILKDL
jgi:hypothetical protein